LSDWGPDKSARADTGMPFWQSGNWTQAGRKSWTGLFRSGGMLHVALPARFCLREGIPDQTSSEVVLFNLLMDQAGNSANPLRYTCHRVAGGSGCWVLDAGAEHFLQYSSGDLASFTTENRAAQYPSSMVWLLLDRLAVDG